MVSGEVTASLGLSGAECGNVLVALYGKVVKWRERNKERNKQRLLPLSPCTVAIPTPITLRIKSALVPRTNRNSKQGLVLQGCWLVTQELNIIYDIRSENQVRRYITTFTKTFTYHRHTSSQVSARQRLR
jgi:hypothetical protein